MIKKIFNLFLISFCISILFTLSAEASTIDSLNEYLTQLQFNDYYSVKESFDSSNTAGTESVSTANGGLNFVKTDLTLPGKAGFDLNLTRRISSAVPVEENGGIYYVNVGNWLYSGEQRTSYKYIFKYYVDGEKATSPIYIAYDIIDDMLEAENGTNCIVVSEEFLSVSPRNMETLSDYTTEITENSIGMTNADSFYLYSDLPLGDAIILKRDLESEYAMLQLSSDFIYDLSYDRKTTSYYLYGGWTYDFPILNFESTTTRLLYRGEEAVEDAQGNILYDEKEYKYSYLLIEPSSGRTLRIEVCYYVDAETKKVYGPYEDVFYYAYSGSKIRKLSTTVYSVEMDWNMKDDEAYIYITNDKGVVYEFGTSARNPKIISMTDRYGNKISFNGKQITDTIGRKIDIKPNDGIYVNGKKEIQFELIVENNYFVDPKDILYADNVYNYRISPYDAEKEKAYGTTVYRYKNSQKKWYTGVNENLPFVATNRFEINLLEGITFPGGAESTYDYCYVDVNAKGQSDASDNNLVMKERKVLLSSRYDTVDGIVKNKVNYSYDFSDKDNKCTTVTYEDRPGYITKDFYDENDFLIKSIVQNTDEGNAYQITKDYKNITSNLGERVPSQITTTTSSVAGGSSNVVIENYTYDETGNVVQTVRDGIIIQNAAYSFYNMPLYELYLKENSSFAGIYNTFTYDKKSIATSSVAGKSAPSSAITQYESTSYTYNAYGDIISVNEAGVNTQIDYEYTAYNDTNQLENSMKKIYTVRSVPTVSDTDDNFVSKDIVREEEFDYLGRLASSKDAKGNVTEYEYDSHNNLTKTTNPDGSVFTNEYDYVNNTLISTDESGVKIKYEFDPLGYDKKAYLYNGETFIPIVDRIYDASYNLTEVILLNEDTSVKGKSVFTYYSDKNLSSEILYDGETLVGKKEYRNYPYHADNSSKKETKVFKTEIDFITLSQYTDKYGYKTKDTIDTSDKTYLQTYVTDYLGNIVSSRNFRANEENLEGNSVEYTYDCANRVLTETTPSGTITNSYNSRTGLLSTITDAKGNITSYTYDNMGRLYLETSQNKRTDYFYDEAGNPSQIRTYTDAKNYNVTKNIYDNRGRLSASITEPKHGEEIITKYTYDPAGKVLSVAQGLSGINDTPSKDNHRITEYVYDVFGNLVCETDPLGQSDEYTYDVHKNLVQSRDKNGTVFTYTYDVLSRLLSKSYTTADGETDSVSYSYDMLGNMLTMIDNQGEILYNYDDIGNVLSEISGDISKAYTYDANGNMTSYRLDIDGEQKQGIAYTYDLSDRVSQIADGSVVTSYTYDANGNILTENVTEGNSVRKLTEFTYNPLNMPLYKKVSTGSDFEEYDMTYDYSGNAVKVNSKIYNNAKNKTHNNSVSYTYDGTNRLIKEQYSNGDLIEYFYDEFGNMSSKINGDVTTTYEYDKNNQLTQQNEKNPDSDIENITKYFYDYNGNMIFEIKEIVNVPHNPKSNLFKLEQDYSELMSSFEYDGWNRLKNVTNKNCFAQYTYRGDNLRNSKTIIIDNQPTTTDFVYNGMDIVYDATDDTSNTYSRGLLGITFRTDGQNQQSFFRTNQHGDVSAVTNADGSLLTSYRYDAYGNIISESNSNDDNPFAYCGEYLDKETGLIYLRNRYYDPEVGRFITQDPIKDGLNWYVYCNSNPVMFVDPSGHSIDTIVDVAGAVWSLGEFLAAPTLPNALSLVWDVAAIVVPFVPGSYITDGGKYILKTTSKSDSVADSFKVLKVADRAKAIKDGALTMPYKALKKLSQNTGLEAHHLIEKRFAKKLGINENDILSIAIDPDTHKKITKAFRDEIDYGGVSAKKGRRNTQSASVQEVWDATVKVYKKFGMTEYLQPLKDMMKEAGHSLKWGKW